MSFPDSIIFKSEIVPIQPTFIYNGQIQDAGYDIKTKEVRYAIYRIDAAIEVKVSSLNKISFKKSNYRAVILSGLSLISGSLAFVFFGPVMPILSIASLTLSIALSIFFLVRQFPKKQEFNSRNLPNHLAIQRKGLLNLGDDLAFPYILKNDLGRNFLHPKEVEAFWIKWTSFFFYQYKIVRTAIEVDLFFDQNPFDHDIFSQSVLQDTQLNYQEKKQRFIHLKNIYLKLLEKNKEEINELEIKKNKQIEGIKVLLFQSRDSRIFEERGGAINSTYQLPEQIENQTLFRLEQLNEEKYYIELKKLDLEFNSLKKECKEKLDQEKITIFKQLIEEFSCNVFPYPPYVQTGFNQPPHIYFQPIQPSAPPDDIHISYQDHQNVSNNHQSLYPKINF